MAATREHDLMIPPPGYKFIPRCEVVCGRAGCFECYDIYCDRCESKDRRIIELELRNSELVKHITLLHQRLLKKDSGEYSAYGQPGTGAVNARGGTGPFAGGVSTGGAAGGSNDPFAFVQSPVLYDPALNMPYVATTAFTSPQPGAARPS